MQYVYAIVGHLCQDIAKLYVGVGLRYLRLAIRCSERRIALLETRANL